MQTYCLSTRINKHTKGGGGGGQIVLHKRGEQIFSHGKGGTIFRQFGFGYMLHVGGDCGNDVINGEEEQSKQGLCRN